MLPKSSAPESVELFWFLCMVVAGKQAKPQQDKVNDFVEHLNADGHDPRGAGIFTWLGALPKDERTAEIERRLRAVRMGQYGRLTAAMNASCDIAPRLVDPRITRDTLTSIPGVGLKTASFFCMYAHRSRVAVLDTHIVAHLKQLELLPESFALSARNYLHAEEVFLKLCARYNTEPWVLDFDIWSSRSTSSTL